jgi:hypothetical protein
MALSFIKTGAESAKLAQKNALEVKQRQEQQGKIRRFYIKNVGEDARITFIDGNLGPDGFIVPSRWYEHNLLLNGKWFNYFVCPEKTMPDLNDPCPIEETGDIATLVAGFTVIDHRSFKGKNDKTYMNERRLLIAKPDSVELLNKLAVKRGGLAGCTFDVSRVGSLSPNIGSMFDFVEKKPVEDLQKLYVHEVVDPKTNQKSTQTYFIPANFEEEIVYRTGDELRALGLGKLKGAAAGIASPAGQTTGASVNYADKL